MLVGLTVSLPEHALENLMVRYRAGDPELMSVLREFGVLAIQPQDEQAIDTWENEGGR